MRLTFSGRIFVNGEILQFNFFFLSHIDSMSSSQRMQLIVHIKLYLHFLFCSRQLLLLFLKFHHKKVLIFEMQRSARRIKLNIQYTPFCYCLITIWLKNSKATTAYLNTTQHLFHKKFIFNQIFLREWVGKWNLSFEWNSLSSTKIFSRIRLVFPSICHSFRKRFCT